MPASGELGGPVVGGGCEGGGVNPRPRWGHMCRWGLPGLLDPHRLEAQVGVRGASRTGTAGHWAPDPDDSAGSPPPRPGLAAHRRCPWGGDHVSSDLLASSDAHLPSPQIPLGPGIMPPDSPLMVTMVSFLVVGGGS